jgi:hypothetical protein
MGNGVWWLHEGASYESLHRQHSELVDEKYQMHCTTFTNSPSLYRNGSCIMVLQVAAAKTTTWKVNTSALKLENIFSQN